MMNARIKFLVIRVTQHTAPITEEINAARAIGVQTYLVERFQDLHTVMDEVVDETCQKEGNVHCAMGASIF